MQQYKIIIAYDGTDYSGWQIQPHKPSIAQALQDSFYRVFKEKIRLRAVSRTDAGVHALGQIATFTSDLRLPPAAMLHAWSNVLPADIIIRDLQAVAPDFNPHAYVAYKTYWYHVALERPLPFAQRFGAYYRYPVDIQKLEDALQIFIGTHDFRSYSTGDERADTVRTIVNISLTWAPDYGAYRIAISGPKFLRYMIRRIVGACLEVARRPELPISLLDEILQAKNPEHVLPKAPAQGLLLYEVCYKERME